MTSSPWLQAKPVVQIPWATQIAQCIPSCLGGSESAGESGIPRHNNAATRGAADQVKSINSNNKNIGACKLSVTPIKTVAQGCRLDSQAGGQQGR